MKPQFKLLLLFLLIGAGAMAQDQQNSQIGAKILPTGEKGLVKLLYVNPGEKQVSVNFYGEKGLLFNEKIKSNQFKNGFVKYYDLKSLKPGKYWVEIADSEISVRYEMTFTEETMWVSYWNNYMPQTGLAAR
ncbi:hypothetical protein GCM10009122_16970 [Fulvivirga kasyanovii]|uniref:Secretion system C-terminal sorting domain-containing protein n=1 Tax=Fulvivirga kasyanovii TaxID=396812 RepID=A0ABW9RQX1_9BACT|nr:hypothetical protein [Fulvivirga kasyanovii]MTI26582.1 hypothetical protein [Fulvivirga kasyanovii]